MKGVYEAHMKRWKDADTAVVVVATFPERGQYTEDEIRLSRIDAAKGKSAAGISATAAVNVLVPVGVMFELHVLKKEKYGRLLSEVWIQMDGSKVNVSDILVANGHADYWNGQGPRPRGSAPRIEVAHVAV